MSIGNYLINLNKPGSISIIFLLSELKYEIFFENSLKGTKDSI